MEYQTIILSALFSVWLYKKAGFREVEEKEATEEILVQPIDVDAHEQVAYNEFDTNIDSIPGHSTFMDDRGNIPENTNNLQSSQPWNIDGEPSGYISTPGIRTIKRTAF